MTTTTQIPSSITAPAGVSTARIRVAATGLAAGALTVIALLVTLPWGERRDSSAEEVITYDSVRAVRDAAWSGVLADSFATAVIALCLGLLTLHLVRGRGRVPALVGAVLSTSGGILFAMGGFAFATFAWFASGVPEEIGGPIIDFANSEKGHLLGVTMAGFVLYNLGALTLLAAHVRARTLPVVALVAYVLLTLAQFAPLSGRGVDVVQIVMMSMFVAFAVKVLRAP